MEHCYALEAIGLLMANPESHVLDDHGLVRVWKGPSTSSLGDMTELVRRPRIRQSIKSVRLKDTLYALRLFQRVKQIFGLDQSFT